jgi:peroxisomal membrane protein 2
MSTALSNNTKVFLAWYLTHLSTSPLRTKAITSGVLSGLQELTAQKLSGAKKFDKRIIQMAAYGE